MGPDAEHVAAGPRRRHRRRGDQFDQSKRLAGLVRARVALAELAPRPRLSVHARNDLPSTPSDRAHSPTLGFDAFTAAMHIRASCSSRIFLRSISDLQATSLHGPRSAIIPPSLMGHRAAGADTAEYAVVVITRRAARYRANRK